LRESYIKKRTTKVRFFLFVEGFDFGSQDLWRARSANSTDDLSVGRQQPGLLAMRNLRDRRLSVKVDGKVEFRRRFVANYYRAVDNMYPAFLCVAEEFGDHFKLFSSKN